MEITRKSKIKISMLPNFLFDENQKQYHVSDLTDKELRQFGKEWTEALVIHARNKRKKK